MDLRLALLLHLPIGLKLEWEDFERLSAPEVDISSKASVLAAIQTRPARAYLHYHSDWIERSTGILKESAAQGVRWCHLGQEEYPELWYNLRYRPLIFSYWGEPCWRNTPMLAVVGSRTPSSDTLMWMQKELLEFLRRRRIGVVSGGARGVDQWAHRVALDADRPTVCILPSGLLNPYPHECDHLWERIRDRGGCLVSTCALSEPMRKGFFHTRNRWITGMSPGCFVVEANRRSGSLLTAGLAGEESRDLCTIPVFPLSSQGLGNLDLIIDKQATLIRDHLDLATFWDRLNPRTFEGLKSNNQEQSIDEP